MFQDRSRAKQSCIFHVERPLEVPAEHGAAPFSQVNMDKALLATERLPPFLCYTEVLDMFHAAEAFLGFCRHLQMWSPFHIGFAEVTRFILDQLA